MGQSRPPRCVCGRKKCTRRASSSGFSSRCPCPLCGRRDKDLSKISALGEVEKDLYKTWLSDDCAAVGHPVESCRCGKIILQRLRTAFPVADWNGVDATDSENQSSTHHKKVLDWVAVHGHGFASEPINGGTWLGTGPDTWLATQIYDPFHLDLNCFKVLWSVVIAMVAQLGLSNALSKRLDAKHRLGNMDVGQDDATKKEIKGEFGENAVRVDGGSLTGKDLMRLISDDNRVDVAWGAGGPH